jgi:hypothetical protein
MADDSAADGSDDAVRVWLVERTYSDDEQNLIILVYATTDGERYLRKERALTSSGDDRPTTAAIDARPATSARWTTPRSESATPRRRVGWPTSTTPTTTCS